MAETTLPLGTLEPFSEFDSPRVWGPEGTWRATFGSAVVADLARGLRDHPAAVRARFPGKAMAQSLVLGCVPWFTSEEVADALLGTGGQFCVVVDKSAFWHPQQLDRLSREGFGVGELPGLEFWGRPESGRPPTIGPSTPQFDIVLEPVRMVGYRTGPRKNQPLLHSKLAVCCATYTWENDMGSSEDHVVPMSVWMGSANWTERSRWHLEFGAWCSDPALAEAALTYVLAVVKVSEPPGSLAERPSPEMVEGEWDDAAFAEYLSEHPSEPDDADE
jgi:hypothetical protein